MLIGLPAPVSADRLPDVHGMLLVLGFVGTLIALERAVALGHRAGFLAPGLLGAGAVLLVSPAPLVAGRSTLLAGTVALAAVYIPLWRRQRDDAVLVQALGAVLAVGAATLWLGGVRVPSLLPWLVGFIVLTIAGERLELARIAMGPRAGRTLVLLAAGVLVTVTASLLWPAVGAPALGLVLVVLVGWLAVHDVARRTVRSDGLVRFMAASMLAGYFWLAVAGSVWLVGGPTTRRSEVRRTGARGVPGLHDLDDHGPRPGDPSRRAPTADGLPPRAARAGRRASPLTRPPAVGR